MPLRFSDIGSMMPDPQQFNVRLTDSGFADMKRRSWQAKQNVLERQAAEAELGAKLGAEQEMMMAKLAAEKGKNTDEARRKFMERVSGAVRSGDAEAVRALSLEAPQYSLSIDEQGNMADQADKSQMSELELAQNAEQAKQPPKFMLNADGQMTPLDVYGAQDRNRQHSKEVYGAIGNNMSPRDRSAAKQAFDTAIALGRPIEEVMKLIKPDDLTSRLDREHGDVRSENSLNEKRMEFNIASGQRMGEHEDRMGLQREALDLRGQEAANRDAARDANQAARWSGDARAMTKDLGILQRRDLSQSAGKILKLLDSRTTVPGAGPGKAQIIAMGEMAKVAQAGDPRISDKDRAAMADEWSVVDSVLGAVERKAYGELSQDILSSFEEALARIIRYNDQKQRESMTEMAVAKMNLPPEGQDQFDRYINVHFGREPWFPDEAKALGVTVYPARGNTPVGAPRAAESSATPAGDTAPSDDDLSKSLEAGGF